MNMYMITRNICYIYFNLILLVLINSFSNKWIISIITFLIQNAYVNAYVKDHNLSTRILSWLVFVCLQTCKIGEIHDFITCLNWTEDLDAPQMRYTY